MTDFQVSSSFYSGVTDLNWINKSSGLWENSNFNSTPNTNNIKKNMVINNPNPLSSNLNNSGGFFQQQQQQVPVSIKSSEFINVSNSELWSNNTGNSNIINSLNSSGNIPINSNSNSSSNSINSSTTTSPSQNSILESSQPPSPLSGSSSILPPPKRKGLIKAHSEDSFQPIQQQFLAQLQQQQQQQQLQQSQDDENNANSDNDIEEEITGQSRYKTELCRSFAETGICRYGIKCQFAHGKDELRPVVRHPKYKTETCKTFHSTGSCPYGSRCRFIHISPNTILPVDENQLQVLQQQHLQKQQQQQQQQQQQHLSVSGINGGPIMTRQNSSPQLSLQQQQQHLHLQPLLQQLQQLKIQPTLQQLQALQQQQLHQQQQQQLQQQQYQQQQPLHQSQPIPKPQITWSNSWSADEAGSTAASSKSPSKKRLNVFKTICSNSNWN